MSFLGLHPGVKLEAFDKLHTFIIGGAPLGAAAANRLVERLGKSDLLMQEGDFIICLTVSKFTLFATAIIFPGYGMTETSSVTHLGPLKNNVIGSFGEPVTRTKVKVLDINTGEALGPGQQGEMYVSGPQLMKGYYKNPKATEEIIDSDGWLHTGDIVYYNEQHQFFMVDRLKELIKVKGFQVCWECCRVCIPCFINLICICKWQVSPSELEDVLRLHPSVLDVAVIGVPDDKSGELPRAYVVKKSGISVSKEDIINFVDTKVAPYKSLKGGVVFIDAIPKTNTGKLVRREFKNMVLSQQSEV